MKAGKREVEDFATLGLTKDSLKTLLESIDSTDRVYEFFKKLGYKKAGNKVKFFDKTYKQEVDLPKDEKARLESVHPVFSFGKNNGVFKSEINIFFVKAKSVSNSLLRALNKSFSEQPQKFMLIITKDFSEITFVLPDITATEEGKSKLKLTKLTVSRDDIYRTDLEVLFGLVYVGQDTGRELWRTWREAFRLEKVTEAFFEDYKQAFLDLRKTVISQKFSVKQAHEFSLQLLNRIMFIYFISKKKWLGENTKFIRWLWHEKYLHARSLNPSLKDSFYDVWLKTVFFEAFNNRFEGNASLPSDVCKVLDKAPFLNGGLFKDNELDKLPVKISDDLFMRIFRFYEKYNFTIKEDLPLEVEVAVDPQMIGYVYESLANVAEEIYDRNDLGIFYTPKVEVEFMCRRSLVEYFSKQLPKIPKEHIYRLLFDSEKEKVEEKISKLGGWRDLGEASDRIAVVDPACGSGAFLVGMLNVLTEITRLVYKNLNRSRSDFSIKKRIISRSLYGVDVMPWAIHAAELRLWLQLIVETDFLPEERRKQPLLPNLDMNLRIGDSLVQEIGGLRMDVRANGLKPHLRQTLDTLKQEKEKYANNDPTCKFGEPREVFEEEVRLFKDIIDERVSSLESDIDTVSREFGGKQAGLFGEAIEDKRKSREKEQKAKEDVLAWQNEIEDLKNMKLELEKPEKKPFVWEIDFAEIFSSDRQGFDIVIGNPPYVRQEKISPPNRLKDEVTLDDRKEYKQKLIESVGKRFPYAKPPAARSDLYIYFYFHGLSLLNRNGTFCFITSNSWLDVGYGAELQEFLLRHVPVHAIYDNQAKRSFEHADVNTIIALFGAPLDGAGYARLDDSDSAASPNPALGYPARFVMFKRPFEEVLSSKTLIEIENARAILRTPGYRVYPITQKELLEDGWEYPESYAQGKEPKFSKGSYSGNKWGGKYLRAPDIFFTILEKGKDKLVKLGDIAEVRRGFTTGINDFFYLEPTGKPTTKSCLHVKNGAGWEGEIEEEFLKLVIYSLKEIKTIFPSTQNKYKKMILICNEENRSLVGKKVLDYIKWGEQQKNEDGLFWKEIPSVSARKNWYSLGNWNAAELIFPSKIGERFLVYYNETKLLEDKKQYGIFHKKMSSRDILWSMNSTLLRLYLECTSRQLTGAQAISDIDVQMVKDFLVLNFKYPKPNYIEREVLSIFDECGLDPSKPIHEQEPKPLLDRKELDDIVYDAIGLTKEERKEVYWAVCELVKNRLEKAKSVDR